MFVFGFELGKKDGLGFVLGLQLGVELSTDIALRGSMDLTLFITLNRILKR